MNKFKNQNINDNEYVIVKYQTEFTDFSEKSTSKVTCHLNITADYITSMQIIIFNY